MTFNELPLSEEIIAAINHKGYETPSPVQVQAIPLLLAGKDLLVQSQTGTGKTAAFSLPIIEKLESKNGIQALILCPTRELALQVSSEIRSFLKFKKGFGVVSIYGGEPIYKQIKQLDKNASIVVATPGRLLDHIRRQSVDLKNCHTLVLDEADEMLNMGFIEDIEAIIEELPKERQSAFFSATIPQEIKLLSDRFLNNPEYVSLSKELTVSKITQYYYEVSSQQKTDLTVQLLQLYDAKSTLIFCNTKKMVDDLQNSLNKAGFPAAALHGDMKQEMRTSVMQRFKSGNVSILIATDVAARGIDVSSMDLVLNYDIPQEIEYYVHRIGRTGRAGREGIAITLVNLRQHHALKQIEKMTKAKLTLLPLPSKEDLNQLMIKKMMKDIEKWSKIEHNKLFDIAYNGLRKEKVSQEDIIVAFVNKSLTEYNLLALEDERPAPKRRKSNQAMTTLILNVGKKDQVSPANLVAMITQDARIKGSEIGKISVNNKESLVDVPQDKVSQVLKSLSNSKLKGKKFTVRKK